MSLRKTQSEIAIWADRNFGHAADSINPLLGVMEEAGEICHAVLKGRQGIRGFDDKETRRDAILDGVGDLMIYLLNFCDLENIDAQTALDMTWDKVKQRDWKRNKEKGTP